MTMHEADRTGGGSGGSGPDADLEAFFAAGRREAFVPGQGLVARILADAAAVQAGPPAQPAVVRASGFWASVLGGLGGWAAVGGLATATFAGLWIGFSPPTALAGLADSVLGTAYWAQDAEVDQVDLLPSFDGYLTEG